MIPHDSIKGRNPLFYFGVFNKEQVRTLHLATRMANFKIDEFEEGDLASRGVPWQKRTALLENNCDWFGVTEA